MGVKEKIIILEKNYHMKEYPAAFFLLLFLFPFQLFSQEFELKRFVYLQTKELVHFQTYLDTSGWSINKIYSFKEYNNLIGGVELSRKRDSLIQLYLSNKSNSASISNLELIGDERPTILLYFSNQNRFLGDNPIESISIELPGIWVRRSLRSNRMDALGKKYSPVYNVSFNGTNLSKLLKEVDTYKESIEKKYIINEVDIVKRVYVFANQVLTIETFFADSKRNTNSLRIYSKSDYMTFYAFEKSF